MLRQAVSDFSTQTEMFPLLYTVDFGVNTKDA
jgi:hypothetical protein